VMRTADMLLRLPPLRRRFLRRLGMLVRGKLRGLQPDAQRSNSGTARE
jgi:hypothetical protein